MPSIIQFNDVSKSFNSKLLLDRISFSIKPRTLTTMVGPNGAGKSTVAKLLLGMESPDSGQIIKDPHLKFAYVPQNFSFNEEIPITSEKFIKLLAPDRNILDNKKLTDFANFTQIQSLSIAQLSGGQFQKLLLAANFLNEPDFIVLDEPLQSLDVSSQHDFYHLLEQIKIEHNTTILMISHDLYTVMKSSDQVICLNKHICCSGRPRDLNADKDFIDTMSSFGLYIHNHDHKH